MDKTLLWPLTSLCLWDTLCPYWSWREGTQKGIASLVLTLAIEKWRGRWCLRNCHYPQGFFYHEHYDQGVVMRLLHSSGILFREKHVPVCLSLLQGWDPMNAVHLPLIWFLEGFEWPTCGQPSCNRLYLPNHTWRTLGREVFIPWWGFALVLVVIPGPIGFSLLYKPLQFPFSYKFLYLLLQVPTILCVVVMILVEIAMFLLVTYIGAHP